METTSPRTNHLRRHALSPKRDSTRVAKWLQLKQTKLHSAPWAVFWQLRSSSCGVHAPTRHLPKQTQTGSRRKETSKNAYLGPSWNARPMGKSPMPTTCLPASSAGHTQCAWFVTLNARCLRISASLLSTTLAWSLNCAMTRFSLRLHTWPENCIPKDFMV